MIAREEVRGWTWRRLSDAFNRLHDVADAGPPVPQAVADEWRAAINAEVLERVQVRLDRDAVKRGVYRCDRCNRCLPPRADRCPQCRRSAP